MNRAQVLRTARQRFAAWWCCAAVASCTPISTPSSTPNDGGLDASPAADSDGAAADGGGEHTSHSMLGVGAAGSSGQPAKNSGGLPSSKDIDAGPLELIPPGEQCDKDAAVRCSKASVSRQREVCRDGHWSPAADCGESEVCTNAAQGGEAQCLGVASICRGNAGVAVCDAQGVLYACGDGGVIESTTLCPSARHCQKGVAAKTCAVCLSGEFDCQGDALQRCKNDGSDFIKTQSCAAGGCEATLGQCSGAACTETRSVCRGDVLSTCGAGEMNYRDVTTCMPGLCDADRGACNRCIPGIETCSGDTAVRCSADGATEQRSDCSANGGHCVGAGRCVTCARDADCPDPGACLRASCNLAKGTCEPEARTPGTACAGGVCSASGSCVGCNRASDCPAPGDCQVRNCEAGSCKPKPAGGSSACGNGGKCTGSGQCASCVADSDCPSAPACQVRHCDTASGSCRPTNAAKGVMCQAGTCDGSGQCTGCNSEADCPAVGACQQKSCNPNTHVCEARAAGDGGSCSANFGTGSCSAGHCVQCTNDAACSGAGTCQTAFCRTSDNSCQKRSSASGVDCGGGKVCDGAAHCVQCTADMQCGDNAVCLSNACQCKSGFVSNTTGKGCNFDDCAKPDDNRCGADTSTGNTCTNTQAGFDCSCNPPWKLGIHQCFQGGTGQIATNNSSWDVLPSFRVVCSTAFATQSGEDDPCPTPGQLTWLDTCGLDPNNTTTCSVLAGSNTELNTTQLRRVSYAGALEDYGQPPTDGSFSDGINLPAAGDVILVQSLTALFVMRIQSIDSNASLTYDWAMLWRDTCWRPGGASCTAACGCSGGS